MTTADEFLTKLRAALARDLGDGLEVGSGGLGLGFFTSTGRQVGVRVRRTLIETMLEVSDGGASWMDLVMGGYADAIPTPTEQEKIDRLCSMHGVRWAREVGEVSTIVDVADFGTAARRIAAVSLAMDGWRAWYPPVQELRVPNSAMIVRSVARSASRAGWRLGARRHVRGTIHRWMADAVLSKNGPDANEASICFMQEHRVERAMERAVAWHYDVTTPLVLVVPEKTAAAMRDSTELTREIVPVPRTEKGTAKRILEAAGQAIAPF